jgi:tripartite-type tricarboxylate transporter receptor subunit TctC
MAKSSVKRSVVTRTILATVAFALPLSLARAQSAEDFFRKAGHLTMYVGSDAGGGFDQIARLVARHLSRFLPGNPSFVIENMPTALGIQASNFLYNSAPKDGSAILADSNSAVTVPLFGLAAAHYDPRRFEWIGSVGKQQSICFTWKTSGIKTYEDATKRVVVMGANAINDHGGVYPMILNDLLGTKFKVVAGYSTGARNLALERGEVEGLCGYSWQSFQAIGTKWFENNDVNMLLQMGMTKNADLPDVPLADDLLKTKEDKQVFDLIGLQQEFGRPFIAPPDTPADRMAVYRKAYKDLVKDPQFLAEAKTQRIAIDSMDDKEIEALLAEAYAAPKRIHDRAAVFAAQMN